MRRTLVAGIGSPFGEDRAGWAAVEAARRALGASAPEDCGAHFICFDRPGAALAHALAEWDAAILADAMHTGAPPGTVRVIAPDELGTDRVGACSTHGFGIADALRLAAALGTLPARLALVGIEADPAAAEHELSRAVTAALPAAVAEIRRLLRE
jgi:hydrogenase maturation protease